MTPTTSVPGNGLGTTSKQGTGRPGTVCEPDRPLVAGSSPRLGLSDKQRAMRASGLGASEVPTALGLNPWKSAAELAAEKRGELEPAEAGEAALWGHRFERPIADEFLSRRRAEGMLVDIFTPPTLRHPTSPVLMATCDRIMVPVGLRARALWLAALEIKNLSMFRREEFGEAADDIPETILVQVQTQLEVTGLEDVWLAVVLGGQNYQERHLTRDREMGGQLVAFVEKWWSDHVVQGIPVPVDGSEASSAYLRRRFPVETAPALAATDSLAAMVTELRAAKARAAEARAAEDLASNTLRAAIGEAAGIAGLCTYKQQKGSTYTVTREPTRVLRLVKEK